MSTFTVFWATVLASVATFALFISVREIVDAMRRTATAHMGQENVTWVKAVLVAGRVLSVGVTGAAIAGAEVLPTYLLFFPEIELQLSDVPRWSAIISSVTASATALLFTFTWRRPVQQSARKVESVDDVLVSLGLTWKPSVSKTD